LWIRRNVPESPRWEEANARRRFAHAQRQSGAVLGGVDAALTRFTVVDLFSDRSVRRPLIFAFLMMLSVTFAFYGVGTFIPTYVAGVAAKAGLSGPAWAGWAGLITSVGGTFGFVSLGFLADAVGRKPTVMRPDPTRLSVGRQLGLRSAAGSGRYLRLLHARRLGLGAGMAA
jgi:MFS family permease